MVHEGKKHHPCSDCDKKFAVNGDLKLHIKAGHEGKKHSNVIFLIQDFHIMSDLKNSKINASNWNLKWQKDWKKERISKWKTNAHLKFRPHERGQFGAKFQKAAVETTHQSCSFRNKAIQVFWMPLYFCEQFHLGKTC